MKALTLASVVLLASCPAPSVPIGPADGTTDTPPPRDAGPQEDAAPDSPSVPDADAEGLAELSHGLTELPQPRPTCPSTGDGTVAGTVTLEALDECSGLVASRRNPGVLWAHNDSGAGPTLYALGADGAHLGTFHVTGAQSNDWEDLALARGPAGSADRLMIGDIGDNFAQRPSVTVYAVDEPTVPSAGGVDDATAAADALTMIYEDGARDAEGLVVDPADGTLYVVSKAWNDGVSGLYRYPPPLRPDDTVTLERVADITLDDLGGGGSFLATGADVSPDGAWFVLRTYDNVLAWRRPAGAPLKAAFTSERCHWAHPNEPQGEAIAVAADGSAYYTLSESTDQPLWYFSIANTP